ncbi:MAG: ABC transporter ATP-binding protein [Flavisolibacter sp.]
MFPLLQIKNLTVDFITARNTTHAVKNISFNIKRGEIVALVGESGSGKTVTALSILQLMPMPPAKFVKGEILFSDNGQTQTNLLDATNSTLQQIRGNQISMVFQEPMSSLNPLMTCGNQVIEALRAHQKVSKSEARKKTLQWFEELGLPTEENSFNKFPHQLSGGQKQRVMIAISMCLHPALLLCDEPTTALDVTVQKKILQLIKALQLKHDMGVLFITHDLGVVAEIADRVAIMYQGEIVELNDKENIFHHPTHPYTKALIACRPSNSQKGKVLPVIADFLEVQPKQAIKNLTSLPLDPPSEIMRVQDLSLRYVIKRDFFGRPIRTVTALDKVGFTLYHNETLGLVGESGCGKTTLGRCLLRLINPDSGEIFYKDINLLDGTQKTIKHLRQEVQLVFQDPYSSLNPTLTIEQTLTEPLKLLGNEKRIPDKRKRVKELLDQVQLPPSAMGKYPHEFSGGQRQRIVIARALALDPGVLVCDESVSALDVSVQAQVLNLLNELKAQLGLTLLFITHDLSVVRYMCDRIMVMQKGSIVEIGATESVFHHPKHAYTKSLFTSLPTLL